jgi:hypothetical protein
LLRQHKAPASFGFVGDAGDMNRFWSRYRLARSFREVVIEVFAPDTVRGYSALVRVFLVWSAFEQFMRICGLNLRTAGALLRPYGVPKFEAAVRAVQNHRGFLVAVYRHLDRQPYIQGMEAFLAVRPCNVLVIPVSIRHIFAHGKLAPNSGVGNVNAACAISDIVCEFLFQVMNGEFVARLQKHGIKV